MIVFYFYQRTATILCKEDSHFAILTRQSYQNILSAHHNKSKNDHLNFLQNLPIFQGWSMGNMEQLYYQFIAETYTKNHIFYTEENNSDHFYFIKSGEIEVK